MVKSTVEISQNRKSCGLLVWTVSRSMYYRGVRWLLHFKVSRYREGYSFLLKDLRFKISEGSDQNWSCPVGCLSLAEPSEILNIRSSRNCSILDTLIPWSDLNPLHYILSSCILVIWSKVNFWFLSTYWQYLDITHAVVRQLQ